VPFRPSIHPFNPPTTTFLLLSRVVSTFPSPCNDKPFLTTSTKASIICEEAHRFYDVYEGVHRLRRRASLLRRLRRRASFEKTRIVLRRLRRRASFYDVYEGIVLRRLRRRASFATILRYDRVILQHKERSDFTIRAIAIVSYGRRFSTLHHHRHCPIRLWNR
jgi:hypothetical protein